MEGRNAIVSSFFKNVFKLFSKSTDISLIKIIIDGWILFLSSVKT